MADKQIDAIRDDLTAAAQLSASTARDLAQMAHDLVPRVTPSDPMESQDILQSIAVLTKLVNEASAIGRALLAQQKTTKPAAAAGEHEDQPCMNSVAAGIVTSLNARRGKR